MHGGMGYGRPEPDVEGDRTLEYVLVQPTSWEHMVQET